MDLTVIMEYLPFLIPLVVVDLAFSITALVHVLRHPQYRFGNKVMWAVIVIIFQIIGPAVYFVFGRGED